MEEKDYGQNKTLYRTVRRDDGWLELLVYHANRELRQLLRDHRSNPRYFLGRRQAFARSTISAQRSLADVIDDRATYFAANRVHIILDSEPYDQPGSVARPPDPAPSPRTTPSATHARTIALVACVGKKKNRPLPAGELYDSDWFHKASAYARRTADAWYILSAKYGLVPPERTIAPYDETLNTMPAAARREWALRVLADLREVLRPDDRVLMLAGAAYREHLLGPIRQLGCHVEVPMEGLRIGEQLSWLSWLNRPPAPSLPV